MGALCVAFPHKDATNYGYIMLSLSIYIYLKTNWIREGENATNLLSTNNVNVANSNNNYTLSFILRYSLQLPALCPPLKVHYVETPNMNNGPKMDFNIFV